MSQYIMILFVCLFDDDDRLIYDLLVERKVIRTQKY